MARAPGKAAFRDAVGRWDLPAVIAALAARPELARDVDADGWTPLHRCARVVPAPPGRPEEAGVAVARALVDAGGPLDAIREIPDGDALFPATALWYAVAWGRNAALSAFLLDCGASPAGCVWAVCFHQDIALADRLHAAGMDLDARFHGRTALVESVAGARDRSVDWLLAHGADPELADADGRTPLFHAVRTRAPTRRLDALIAAGARADRADAEGVTPVALARAQGRTRVAAHLEASLNRG